MVEDHRGGPVTKIAASALDHRPFWDAMHAVTLDQLEEISQPMLCAWSRCVLGGPDMANFATFIDTDNEKAPVASAREGQAETLRPAPGRPGPGSQPRRRDPADVARLAVTTIARALPHRSTPSIPPATSTSNT